MSVSSAAINRGSVLVVEDDEQTARLLSRLLIRDGFNVDVVADGARVIQMVAASSPDIVLLDWMLPGISGIDLCRQLKRDPSTRLIPIVLVTGLDARENRLEGINAGADDFLTKPFDSDELRARVRSLTRLKRYTDELDSAESVITSLALTVEARDTSTDGHCHRLAQYATTLGEAAGEGPEALAALERGGYLHDVGKIGIPDAVLLKPGKLSADETAIMRQHTLIGERLCGNLRSLAPVRPIVRHHHERLDGSGYPDGLRGSSIPLAAQIVGIVDTFDAVTSDRPYRPARSLEAACDELITDQRNGLFDAELIQLFLKLIDVGLIRVPANVS
ncbi:MAG: HD domain-containing phosphohydrolase [bacterium]